MTGDLLIDSLISLGAMAVMVFTAWFAFRTPHQTVDKEAARERLAFDEPDFRPVAWLVDEKGRAVLAEGEGDDYALVFRFGADLVTRRFHKGGANAELRENTLVMRPDDPGASSVTLSGEGVADWMSKVADF